MLITYIILAISVSIDSLGIGITYGIKNTKLDFISKIILFIISICITSISVNIGNKLSSIFNGNIITLINSILLFLMGIFVIYQALKKDSDTTKIIKNDPKIYKFFIEFLGITIQIIRNPIYCDLDGSKKIDWKEAIYLGFTLSIDSFCIGIFSSIISNSTFIFPFLAASFQLIFLTIGNFIGKQISSKTSLPENIWSIISGILLICIGISKIIK